MKKIQLVVLLMLLTLCGCSTYPSQFKCVDSRGLGCTMLSSVDKQIESGEIQEIYLSKSKCKGKNCPLSDKEILENKPQLRFKQKQKVKRLQPAPKIEEEIDGYWEL